MRFRIAYLLSAVALIVLQPGAEARKKPGKTVAEMPDSLVRALPDSLVRRVTDSTRIELTDSTLTLSLSKDTLTVGLEPVYSDEYLDTVDIKKTKVINDYSMVGVQYGIALNQMRFNPTKKQGMLMTPMNIGVMYTRYGKMFGYMPYFGFQTGLFYGQDGYVFKKDKETGDYNESVDGATKATYTYLEVPMLAHLHIDVWHLKLIVNIGLYGAYRTGVEREGDRMDPDYANKFYDYDRRFDYGIKGGAGIGLVLDPIEFHITATYRASLGTLYDPDYHSEYYYRFAYPSDIIISAGIHVQLTKRTGKTKAELRKEAKSSVYERNQQ